MVHDGRLVYETYRNGMTETDRHVAHSCSKTLTTMMVGIAIAEGMLEPVAPDRATTSRSSRRCRPGTGSRSSTSSTWRPGIDLEEHYEDADSMYWRYADAVGYYPGSAAAPGQHAGRSLTAELTRAAEPPGVRFNYGSYLTNLLPIALANVYGVPAVELYEDRIYRHLGAERLGAGQPRLGRATRSWRVRSTSPCATSSAGATSSRTRAGRSAAHRSSPEQWVDDTYAPSADRAAAFARGAYGETMPGAEYHNQTWVLEPGRVVTMLGIHGQFCWVDRQTRTMIVGLLLVPGARPTTCCSGDA